jgi:nucleoside-diphosphate-sugar epimerase
MTEYKKTALVLGAGGFIGSHMVRRLKLEGYWVRGVDLKYPEFSSTEIRNRVYLLEKQKRNDTVLDNQLELQQYSPELLTKYSIKNE